MIALALLALAAATALVVSAAPLVVYATTLALLGFAHVVVELRYVRDRFAGRLERRLVVAWLVLLGLIVASRVTALLRVALPFDRGVAELALLAALLLVTALGAPHGRRLAALALSAPLGTALWMAPPAAALALLAFAHNLTPLGFLAERLRGRAAAPALLVAAVAFLVVPLLLLAGAGDFLLERLALPRSDGAFLAIGEVDDHFTAFLPPAWLAEEFAPRLFTAAVYLQCAHYFAVLHVLPRLQATTGATERDATAVPASRPASVAPWRRRAIVAAALLTGAALLLLFHRSFPDGRRIYGVAAALHAYLEWPLLLAVVIGAAPLATSLRRGAPA